jgi:signal transduction histidine kinase
VRIAGSPPPDLDRAVDHAAYRIVQEALTNAVRHGEPGHASVEIEYGRGRIDVRVRNGLRGSDVSRSNPETAGLGLRGMRERVALVDGVLFAGPTPAGEWLVEARLAWDRERRS